MGKLWPQRAIRSADRTGNSTGDFRAPQPMSHAGTSASTVAVRLSDEHSCSKIVDRDTAQFGGGIALAVLAAALMLLTDGPISASITLLIVGLSLIAISRRSRSLF